MFWVIWAGDTAGKKITFVRHSLTELVSCRLKGERFNLGESSAPPVTIMMIDLWFVPYLLSTKTSLIVKYQQTGSSETICTMDG